MGNKALFAFELGSDCIVLLLQALVGDFDLIEHVLDALEVATVSFELLLIFVGLLDHLLVLEVLDLLDKSVSNLLDFAGFLGRIKTFTLRDHGHLRASAITINSYTLRLPNILVFAIS